MKKPQLSDLTLKEKIAQCLCIPQFDLNNKTEVDRGQLRTKEERDKLISDEQYGCIWCHGGQSFNAKLDMAELNWGTKVSSRDYIEWVKGNENNLKIPSLRSIDGESGSTFCDLTPTCRAISLGATDDVNLAYELAAAGGKELKCAGINWKWGPVVDIHSSHFASVSRTYSQDPDTIIKFANAQIKGLQSVGVAATAKHFPGGDRYEYRDSHFTSTMLFSTMEEWWAEQGKIFQEIIDGGVYSIMTSHKSFPACDDTKINGQYIPVTLSKKVTTDLLKGTLRFKGVVVTDCINMGGLVSIYPHDKLIVEIMKAGNDVILSADIHDADILEKAVLSGELPESRIDDACQRILDMKEKIGLFDDNYTIDQYTPEETTPATRALNEVAAKKSITLVRDNLNLLPLDPQKIKNVAIICLSHVDTYMKQLGSLVEELEARGINVKIQRRIASLDELKKIDEENDLILYMVYTDMHKPKGGTGLFAEECQALHHAFSYGKEKSIGVSTGYPYIHYNYLGNAETFINTYTHSPAVMRAMVQAMFGDIPFEGKSPVPLVPEVRIW